ncbi:hypothetical protein VB711_16940 [Cronbergia sp. UHCC 0137]|uniref:hypothetical protein n=1 Tax=Cronbergia sp. UHCC 0137 TaxID=3110239 RepID=UPI002B21CB38|nr:hypothetical protein [Cronbergia sp. UHCC 0137]MEA5619513.1 hypothetical protein [Cronbergia sp. UHCC 0137]
MSATNVINTLQQAVNCKGKCDCCTSLQNQINQLNSKINLLQGQFIPKSDRPQIIDSAVLVAGAVILPRAAQQASQITEGAVRPLRYIISETVKKIDNLINQLPPIRNQVEDNRLRIGNLAGAVAGILTMLQSTLNDIGILKLLGRRIDLVERGLAMVEAATFRAQDTANRALTNSRENKSAIEVIKRDLAIVNDNIDIVQSNLFNFINEFNRFQSYVNSQLGRIDQLFQSLAELAQRFRDDINYVFKIAQQALSKADNAEIIATGAFNLARELSGQFPGLKASIGEARELALRALGLGEVNSRDIATNKRDIASNSNRITQNTNKINQVEGSIWQQLQNLSGNISNLATDTNNKINNTRTNLELKLEQENNKLRADLKKETENIKYIGQQESLKLEERFIERQKSERELSQERFDRQVQQQNQNLFKEVDKFAKQAQTERDLFSAEQDRKRKLSEQQLRQEWDRDRQEDLKNFDLYKGDIKKIQEASKQREDARTLEFVKLRQEQTKTATQIQQEKQQRVMQDKKLDQLINLSKQARQQRERDYGTLAGIGLAVGGFNAILTAIPGKTAGQIVPAITPSVNNALCNNNCLKQSFDNNANKINQNTNRAIDPINAGNAAANAGLLAGQREILKRLGNYVPQGLSGFMQRFSQWSMLNQALNILTTAATIHNAMMLSKDIGTTLIQTIQNVLQFVGLKDSEGKGYDIGAIVGAEITFFLKGLVGAENYVSITLAWAKANRIYQASTNILNSFQGIGSTILDGLEMVGSGQGKIGNALRACGAVLDNAYGWMNPQPKFNRITQALENAQNLASTVEQISQVPLELTEQITQLTTESTDLIKAIKEDANPNNKGKELPEADTVKAKKQAEKTASVAVEPEFFDFNFDIDLIDGGIE